VALIRLASQLRWKADLLEEGGTQFATIAGAWIQTTDDGFHMGDFFIDHEGYRTIGFSRARASALAGGSQPPRGRASTTARPLPFRC